MKVTGKKSGVMTKGASTAPSLGNGYQDEHKDEVKVQAFSHEVTRPYDPQSGAPTGMRIHHPVVITKVFDKSSPILLEALCSGEELTEVEIRWYRNDAYTEEEHYYTTTLEDARVVKIKDYMQHSQGSATAPMAQLQDVHFSYSKISWDHVVAQTSGADDWRKPKTD